MRRSYSPFEKLFLVGAFLGLFLNTYGLVALAQDSSALPNKEETKTQSVTAPLVSPQFVSPALLSVQGQVGEEVGRITLKDGKWVFQGNADASAKIFLDTINRHYDKSEGKGAACRFEDVLDALTVAEVLYIPVKAEEPALIEDPYPGTVTQNHFYALGSTLAIAKLDWDSATPEELRQLAKSREELKTRIAEENAQIKAQVARRNATAQRIRALLSACGVQIASTSGTCGGCGDITTPAAQHLLYHNASSTITLEQGIPSSWTFPQQAPVGTGLSTSTPTQPKTVSRKTRKGKSH